jgi:release factor glutamine methyltransferase
MLTVLDVIKRTTDFFAAKGIESPRLNAELLVGHALRRKRMQLYLEFERPLTETELETIRPLVRRRAQREPWQYIVGETEFFGLRLKVDRRALIPRPETELLVERCVSLMARPPTRILDLGTGTGAMALALAHAFPAATVLATDKSRGALELAAENTAALGLGDRVKLVESDWFSAVETTPFDLIVSNPPYLSAGETSATAPEIQNFEPVSALTGRDGGAGDLEIIVRDSLLRLTSGGLLALETGIDQHAALISLMAAQGYVGVSSEKDLTGRDRFVFGRRA